MKPKSGFTKSILRRVFMENTATKPVEAKVRRGSQPFKASFKNLRKTQRVISLSGRVSKNLDNYCLENEFKPSEAINYILKDFFDKGVQEA